MELTQPTQYCMFYPIIITWILSNVEDKHPSYHVSRCSLVSQQIFARELYHSKAAASSSENFSINIPNILFNSYRNSKYFLTHLSPPDPKTLNPKSQQKISQVKINKYLF